MNTGRADFCIRKVFPLWNPPKRLRRRMAVRRPMRSTFFEDGAVDDGGGEAPQFF
jgi:hypothetical protein